VNTLSHGLSWIDLRFLGRSNVIAAAIVQGPGGAAIVDPGPTTCLGTLEQGLQAHGIGWDDVRHVMLTHIHLDHAGAAGRSCASTRISLCSSTSAVQST
jgi:glyoxylase-like metal-dependent hydrolase (beta-lactamase superfamily II)